MEIFVFPELLYALVLANLMSPRIWAWRKDPWFAKIDEMSASKKINRLKQYIIDHYEFNLDLDTWGLTDQATELKRFSPFIDPETLRRSNALFGYQGDRHYFDLDIRRHFGLEKYNDDTIPYWKTETLEAMDAFSRRDGYRVGAGECVSLSTLYAAALFVVCDIPLEDIFLMATPLHSQNFIAVNDGLLTNNRRIVTKNMWFNGTELTDKAQRALRKEQVTMVFNNSGYVHCAYPNYTMDPAEYGRFRKQIDAYLSTEITFEMIANFLRQHSHFQQCFQIDQEHHGKKRWIPAECAYAYEHGSPFKVSDKSRKKLLAEIDHGEFYCDPLPHRISLLELETFFKNNPIRHVDATSMAQLGEKLECPHEHKNDMLVALAKFIHLQPDLPSVDTKTSRPWKKLEITRDMKRDELIAYLESMRTQNPAADLAFYSMRDLSRTDWTPFLKAALERNPISIHSTKEMDQEAIQRLLKDLAHESIYDGQRLAQPDEVWNFQTGDGVEKAILLANILHARHPDEKIELSVQPDHVELETTGRTFVFESSKGLTALQSLTHPAREISIREEKGRARAKQHKPQRRKAHHGDHGSDRVPAHVVGDRARRSTR